ncbi:MAG: hypothetical protein O3B72_00215 [Proteobacteria bacterium]|nr:hypothetical protein [Pseudomonadota bacterium]
MANFVMLMNESDDSGDWDTYIEKLLATGKFRGGSSLGQGVCVQRGQADTRCQVTGMIRLEADSLDEVKALLEGNPAFEAGYSVQLLEEIED